MRSIVAFLLASFIAQPCWAWSEGGHHLISVMAYELLSEDEQQQIQTILAAHPRFAEDFVPPKNVDGPDETNLWRIGRAGYWPDVARKTKRDRPNWHWQLGATLVLGENAEAPKNPGPIPDDATLDSKDLHIAQAIELCRKIFKDKSRSKSDRALAICWLAHLVGDSHQPCHAGSLYIAGLFPEGDRGANSIPTKQSRNMHSLWDGLLGPRFDAGDVRRRAIEIKADGSTWNAAIEAATKNNGMNPMTWLAESAGYARSHVYTPRVIEAVQAAAMDGQEVAKIDLPKAFLKSAGEVARFRAAFAAQRLAAVLREGL